AWLSAGASRTGQSSDCNELDRGAIWSPFDDLGAALQGHCGLPPSGWLVARSGTALRASESRCLAGSGGRVMRVSDRIHLITWKAPPPPTREGVRRASAEPFAAVCSMCGVAC